MTQKVTQIPRDLQAVKFKIDSAPQFKGFSSNPNFGFEVQFPMLLSSREIPDFPLKINIFL